MMIYVCHNDIFFLSSLFCYRVSHTLFKKLHSPFFLFGRLTHQQVFSLLYDEITLFSLQREKLVVFRAVNKNTISLKAYNMT